MSKGVKGSVNNDFVPKNVFKNCLLVSFFVMLLVPGNWFILISLVPIKSVILIIFEIKNIKYIEPNNSILLFKNNTKHLENYISTNHLFKHFT